MTCVKLILIDMFVCVFSEWGHPENGSYEVICWTALKERFAALLDYWMVTRQAVLLCIALWRVVNLCHLGSIGSTYCSLFMRLWHLEHTHINTLSRWMSHTWVLLRWPDLCGTMFASLAHLFSIGKHLHLWFTTYMLHSLCIPAYLSVRYLALTLCQMCYTPRFPTEAGSRRACPLPAPALLWEWLTSPLFSQVIPWDASTVSHACFFLHQTRN